MKSADRLVPFELNGETYWLLYNLRANQAMQDVAQNLGYTGVNEFLFEEAPDKIIGNVLTMAEALMLQGARYREMNGEKSTPVVSAATMDIILDRDEFDLLYRAVVAAMAAGSRKDVEASPPPKKGNATEIG